MMSIYVQHAVRHNQALLYINEHQKCILNEEKHHVSSLQSQLLEVKSHLQKKPDETSLQQYQMEIASLNQKIERVNYNSYFVIKPKQFCGYNFGSIVSPNLRNIQLCLLGDYITTYISNFNICRLLMEKVCFLIKNLFSFFKS